MKILTRMLRVAALALAALALAASVAQSHASPCQQWHIAGNWSVKRVHSEDLWVGITMHQQGTILTGDAESIVFNAAPGDVRSDSGTVTGTIQGTTVKFNIAWHGRRSGGAYWGELTSPERGKWEVIGQTNDRWWAKSDIVWKAQLEEAGCANASIDPGMEYRTNRLGSDIASIALQSTPDGDVASLREHPTGAWGPQVCERLCLANTNCKAWTLVWAGIQGPKSVCYLKNPAPPRRVDKCCVSGEVVGRTFESQSQIPGIQTGQIVTPGMEDNTDRPGSDYHREEIAPDRRNPEGCQNQCMRSDLCRAWTYVRPGVQGVNGVCYLKHVVPKPVANSCCISGVKPTKTGSGGMTDRGPLAPTPPPNTSGATQREDGGIAGVPTSAGCAPPFVQRKARPSDAVCVTRGSFATVQQENASAPSRWDPNGAYGPQTCISGYVWREAFDGDTVCVTPARRAEVKEENRLAPTRAAAQERPFQPSRTSPGAIEQGGVTQ